VGVSAGAFAKAMNIKGIDDESKSICKKDLS
jgi:hypothetical protein